MQHDPHSHGDGIELPTPTAWPIIAAFGLTLVFAGLVTNIFFTIIGFLTGLVGAAGWFSDVFPHPKHESVPLLPEAERPQPIRTTGRVVQMLKPGIPNRAHVPLEVHPYNSGFQGGLAGGIVMAILATILGLIFDHSIWYPVNLLAAIGVPHLANADAATLHAFSLSGLIVGTIAHFSISILVGFLYAIMVPMFPKKKEWVWGGIIIPLIWTALIYGSMRFISPQFVGGMVNGVHMPGVNWPSFIICQIVFGFVCGYVVFKSGKMETMQSWSISERLGVEAQHREEGK